MFKLDFETSNAAFKDDSARETARILRVIAARIEAGADAGKVHDVNGNVVGLFIFYWEG